MGDSGYGMTSQRIGGVILGIASTFTVLFLSLWIVTSDLGWYSAFQKDRDAYDYIGKTPEETDQAMKDLIRYIQFGGEEKMEPYFNEREIAHMRDVRVLFLIATGILIVSAGWIAAYFWRRRKMGPDPTVLHTARITMVVIVASLGAGVAWMVSSFDRAFLAFHHIFFNNDLWLLNPSTDVMIRMLPQNLFLQLFVRIGLGFVLGVLLCMGLYYFLERRKGVQDASIH